MFRVQRATQAHLYDVHCLFLPLWLKPDSLARDEYERMINRHEVYVMTDGPSNGLRSNVFGAIAFEEWHGKFYVVYLAIHNLYHGRGFGTRLVRYMEKRARCLGYHKIYISDAENPLFYIKLGYTPVPKNPNDLERILSHSKTKTSTRRRIY